MNAATSSSCMLNAIANCLRVFPAKAILFAGNDYYKCALRMVMGKDSQAAAFLRGADVPHCANVLVRAYLGMISVVCPHGGVHCK